MLIDRHLFSEWARVFFLVLALILGILLLEDIFDNLKDLLDYGATLGDIIFYYWNLIPSLLPAVIPISLMISILFSLGQLHQNNEIIALKTIGMSGWRMTRSLWVVGSLLALTMFYLNAHLVPRSVERSRQMREELQFNKELKSSGDQDKVGIIYNVTFNNHKDRRLWFINRFSEYDFRAFGITVSELDEDQNEVVRTVANEGYYDEDYGYWVFKQGRIMSFDQETGDAYRSMPFDEREMSEMTEDPFLMKFREKKPRDLSFFELQRILNKLNPNDDPAVNDYAVQYYSILANPISCLIVVGLAIPFAVSGVRVNPMVGVSKAIGWFFVYYILMSISRILGTKEVVAPIVAAWIPNLLMFGFAMILSRKID